MFRKLYASSIFRFLASSIWIPQPVWGFLTPTIRTIILLGTIRQLRTLISFSSRYTAWYVEQISLLYFFMKKIFTWFSFGLISGSNSTQSSCQTHFSLQESHMLESTCPLLLPRLPKVLFDWYSCFNSELSIMLIKHPDEIYICFKVLKRMWSQLPISRSDFTLYIYNNG